MNQFTKIFKILFFLFVILNLISEFFFFKEGIFFTKPLLLTFLGLYFFSATSGVKSNFKNLLLGGFLFSMLGDTFLMFVENEPPREEFFLLGLSSFLITHILYSIAFFKFPSTQKGLLQKKPFFIIFFLLFLVLNSAFLWKGIPELMRIPVIIYSTTIMTMAMGALNLNGKLPKATFQLLFIGALFFMFSDTLIGINKFRGNDFQIPLVRILIMSTYLLGQYLIAKGGILALQNLNQRTA